MKEIEEIIEECDETILEGDIEANKPIYVDTKPVLRMTDIYSWEMCCEMFGRRYKDKRQFEYLRYEKGAKFALAPSTHRHPRYDKYYITGLELYKFIKTQRPHFISMIKLEHE